MNHWDIVLLVVVSVQATGIAYLRSPAAKALLLTFPFPFSLAFLALGQPVDVTNILGLLLLLAFFHIVHWLHVRGRRNIIISIVSAALVYGLLGGTIANVMPRTHAAFWIATATVLTVAVAVLLRQPFQDEPPYRSPLPVCLKLPLIMLVITLLVLAKQWLEGFMTVFPMVGVIAAYEARYSLWTMTRQIPVIMLSLGPMIVTIYLLQTQAGPYLALSAGWTVFFIILTVLRHRPRQPSLYCPGVTELKES